MNCDTRKMYKNKGLEDFERHLGAIIVVSFTIVLIVVVKYLCTFFSNLP